MKHAPAPSSGFTIIELVLVLVLIAAFAAYTAKSYMDFSDERDQAITVEVFKAHLRYAQQLSMNSETQYGIVASGTSYWMFAEGARSTALTMAGAEASTIAATSEAFAIVFDERGIPFNADNSGNPTTQLVWADDASRITVAGIADAVTITPGTGFIP